MFWRVAFYSALVIFSFTFLMLCNIIDKNLIYRNFKEESLWRT